MFSAILPDPGVDSSLVERIWTSGCGALCRPSAMFRVLLAQAICPLAVWWLAVMAAFWSFALRREPGTVQASQKFWGIGVNRLVGRHFMLGAVEGPGDTEAWFETPDAHG